MIRISTSVERPRQRGQGPACAAWFCAVVALVAGFLASSPAVAVTPESPEVKKLIDAALKYMEGNVDERLGGRCLTGLTFLKAGRRDHARVQEALDACRKAVAMKSTDDATVDNYSNGLAIIFLSELSSKDYAREIQWFLDLMKKRQKKHGGWGYVNLETGDTSQTQYAALSLWEAHRRGFDVGAAAVEQLADWVMRTQGPDGCWGYQGVVSTTGTPVPQTETNCSMLAAGMGCSYICADLFGAKPRQAPSSASGESGALPSALRAADMAANVVKIRPQSTDVPKLLSTIERGHAWMEENYKIDIGPKCFYFLYGMERYKSFQEQLEGRSVPEPKWYNDGFEYLKSSQKDDGSWIGYCGAPCDTAFATLFLLRSTQKSLNAKLGEGSLLSGRGLPTNLSRAKVRNGELIIEQMNTKVDELLSMLDDGDSGLIDDLARDPSQLVVGTVDKQSARRLQQLVRGGGPEVRLVAVRALGRTGNLDYVPSLLYALTDPDERVVIEAREALKFMSRDFKGYGPLDGFNDQQRAEAVNAWKKWYLSLRPTAVLDSPGSK